MTKRACSESDPDFPSLVEQTIARYRGIGRFAQGFVRGKLRHDPVYRALLEFDLIRRGDVLLDLGCGRGIALALLASATRLDALPPRLFGIEQHPKHAQTARTALGTSAEILTGDLRTAELPRAGVVLLIDVLLYLPHDVQDDLLDRIVRAMEPGGLLLMREADRNASWRFRLTQWAERTCALSRGEWSATYHYRSRAAWRQCLEQRGLGVDDLAMSEGTPFANILFIGRLPAQDQH